ncbi:MAG: hypothetical protein JO107_16620 [Hyphomicrobiales bacterium]|nr:hypothetical protein [Hyphomicrobiales bacterium]MBV8664713.1 hypothetical protein [Hyphomicrobiales bacterium]
MAEKTIELDELNYLHDKVTALDDSVAYASIERDTALRLIAAATEAKKLAKELVACFQSGGELGKSLQGWNHPRLHRLRERASRIAGG